MDAERVIYSHIFLDSPFCTNKTSGSYATVAVQIDNKTKNIKYAIAYCAPGDRFSKKKGREVAWTKLISSEESTIISNKTYTKNNGSFYNLCYNLLTLEIKLNKAPSWARKTDIFFNNR